MSAAQIGITGLSLFFLYRFLLETIGARQLGVWSLVLASASASQIANLGLSASVVKFVAKYAARDDHDKVSRLIQTTLITVGGFFGLVLFLVYPAAKAGLSLLLKASALADALSVLPLALISVWFMAILSALNGGLDGYQRTDLRSWLMIGGNVLFLGLALPLVNGSGLYGLAVAQALSYLLLVPVNILLLRRYVRIPFLPRTWDKDLFKEMIRYSLNFQVSTVAKVLFNPTTKILLTNFGSLQAVGFFEMASRAVTQLRGLIVAANQVIVPVFAELTEKSEGNVRRLYLETYKLVSLTALPLFTFLAITMPFISQIWIGRIEPLFVLPGLLLTTGWFVNTLSTPAFFAYLGNGRLRWNTLSSVTTGILNLLLGVALGSVFGGIGVVSGWVLALSLGSLIPLVAYSIESELPWKVLAPRENRWMAMVSLATIGAAWIYYLRLPYESRVSWHSLWLPLSFALVALSVFWRHPVRKQLRSWWTDGSAVEPIVAGDKQTMESPRS